MEGFQPIIQRELTFPTSDRTCINIDKPISTEIQKNALSSHNHDIPFFINLLPPSRPLKNSLLIIPRLLNTLQNIRLGLVQQHLPRHPHQHIQPAPPLRRLLQRADVQDAMAEVVVHLRVRRLAQERLVGVHRVAREQRALGLRHEALDVGEQGRGCLFGARG